MGVSRLSAVKARAQELARKHAGRAFASREPPFGDSRAGSARTALRAEAGLGAKGRTRRAITAAKALTRRTVTAAKTAGAAGTAWRLAAAVVAEAAFTEATLRRAIPRGVPEAATLRTAGIAEATLRATLITLTTPLRARVIGAE